MTLTPGDASDHPGHPGEHPAAAVLPTEGRGRLYRSAGATGPQAALAIPALTQRRELRQARRSEATGATARTGRRARREAERGNGPLSRGRSGRETLTPREERRQQHEERRRLLHGTDGERSTYREEDDPLPPGSRGLALLGITVLVVLIPSVVGFVDVLLFTRVGLLTNATFAACVGISALAARGDDNWTTVVAAPLGYLALVLVSGQSTLGSQGGLLVREVAMVVATLGLNAVWVLSVTGGALVIAVIRAVIARRSVDPISGR